MPPSSSSSISDFMYERLFLHGPTVHTFMRWWLDSIFSAGISLTFHCFLCLCVIFVLFIITDALMTTDGSSKLKEVIAGFHADKQHINLSSLRFGHVQEKGQETEEEGGNNNDDYDASSLPSLTTPLLADVEEADGRTEIQRGEEGTTPAIVALMEPSVTSITTNNVFRFDDGSAAGGGWGGQTGSRL